MSKNNEDYEEREAQKEFYAKEKGYFKCTDCGGMYRPTDMSNYENLCKNCNDDHFDKYDKFEKTR